MDAWVRTLMVFCALRYFRDTKRLSRIFLLMGIIALPSLLTHMTLNKQGVEGCPGTAPTCLIYPMLGNVPAPDDELWQTSFWKNGALIDAPG